MTSDRVVTGNNPCYSYVMSRFQEAAAGPRAVVRMSDTQVVFFADDTHVASSSGFAAFVSTL